MLTSVELVVPGGASPAVEGRLWRGQTIRIAVAGTYVILWAPQGLWGVVGKCPGCDPDGVVWEGGCPGRFLYLALLMVS